MGTRIIESEPVLVTALNAVTATTTSSAINIEGAKKVTLLFTRADHTSGNTVFTVTGSLDGTTFVALNKLVNNAANSNSQTILRTANITLSANGTSLASLDLEHDTFKEIKVVATETTDGTHSAKVLIEY
jgi:hypothetical protein